MSFTIFLSNESGIYCNRMIWRFFKSLSAETIQQHTSFQSWYKNSGNDEGSNLSSKKSQESFCKVKISNSKDFKSLNMAQILHETSIITVDPKTHIIVTCKNCQEEIVTTAETSISKFKMIIGCIYHFWIPFDDWKTITHFCPSCNYMVGKFKNGKYYENN